MHVEFCQYFFLLLVGTCCCSFQYCRLAVQYVVAIVTLLITDQVDGREIRWYTSLLEPQDASYVSHTCKHAHSTLHHTYEPSINIKRKHHISLTCLTYCKFLINQDLVLIFQCSPKICEKGVFSNFICILPICDQYEASRVAGLCAIQIYLNLNILLKISQQVYYVSFRIVPRGVTLGL